MCSSLLTHETKKGPVSRFLSFVVEVGGFGGYVASHSLLVIDT